MKRTNHTRPFSTRTILVGVSILFLTLLIFSQSDGNIVAILSNHSWKVLAQSDTPVTSSAELADGEARIVIVGELPLPSSPDAVLYDQINSPASFNVTSQDFETANNASDSFAADDFVVPAGQTWTVNQVEVVGSYFNGAGPAASVNIAFYANTGSNLPGSPVAGCSYLGAAYSGGANFNVTLPTACVLSSGTYWVSVQSRQDFAPAGQWGWNNRLAAANNGAAWQNPGNGFSTGCTTWGRKTTCLPSQDGPDQLFRLSGTASGGGSIFTVTNVNDSGAGSLRQAIIDANNTAGSNTINFNILPSGAKTISPTFGLPSITGQTFIDATTQPGFSGSPLIELNGANAANAANGLRLFSNNSRIRGFIINRFGGNGIQVSGSNNTVDGNYIGTNAAGTAALPNLGEGIYLDNNGSNNLIGGVTPAARNLVSGNNLNGIFVSGTGTGNQIQGNYIGTNAAGTAAIPNQNNFGIAITAPSTTVGGTTPGARNIISGNRATGIYFASSAQGCQILGNFIGTNATGTAAVPNGIDGIDTGSNGTVGGTVPGAGNIISGNGASGISTGGTGNLIQGNFIGTDISGNPLGNRDGVVFSSGTQNNLVGGTVTGSGNVIAYNRINGVMVVGNAFDLTVNRSSVLGNSIYSNSSLGIDLNGDGVTPNDVGDGDTGGNNLQNFPVLTAASGSSGSFNMQGSLNSVANTTFRIEFFGNDVCDASGYGEGKVYLDFMNVTTDASGNASFNKTLTTQPINNIITSTATRLAAGVPTDTSEFSACYYAGGTIKFNNQPGNDFNNNPAFFGTENQGSVPVTITRTGGAVGFVNVPYQTLNASAIAGSDYVFTSGNPSWADGDSSLRGFNVQLINDAVPEPQENLILSLGPPNGGATLANAFPQTFNTPLFITDDDTIVSVSVNPASVTEDGPGVLTYTFTRNSTVAGSQTVFFSIGGTATAGVDYTVLNAASFSNATGTGSATFAAGSTTTSIVVDPTPDPLIEPDETVILGLTPGGYTIGGPAIVTGMILNDDAAGCPVIPISYGQSKHGVLDNNSCILSGNQLDTYSFGGTAGQQITLSMETTDFFSRIELVDPVGTVIAGVPTQTNSRLPGSGYFTLPSTGTYIIRSIAAFPLAQIAAPDSGFGAYAISLYKQQPTSCTYTLSSPQTFAPSNGGTFSFLVITQYGCPPNPAPPSSGSFYSLVSYQNGRVTFFMPSNPGTGTRPDSIVVGGLVHNISQYGTAAPTNDNFANAQLITGLAPSPTPVTGYNTTATGEANEPQHAGNPTTQATSKSIWYKWTPPAGGNGLYSFTTSGSSFDTVMAIYSCPPIVTCSITNITPVGSNDDTTNFDKTSKVNFRATVGTQYMIAIDGKLGANGTAANGTVQLSWRQYQRLFRLYLQNYNGLPAAFQPTVVATFNGAPDVAGAKISQGVFEFNLPANNNAYTARITGPSGIVWNPNNFPLVDNLSGPAIPLEDRGESPENVNAVQRPRNGQNSVSYAEFEGNPRNFSGFIKDITNQVIPVSCPNPPDEPDRQCCPPGQECISAILSFSRGSESAHDPVDCLIFYDGSHPPATLAQYQCVGTPDTKQDIIPSVFNKKFVDKNLVDKPIDSYDPPINIDQVFLFNIPVFFAKDATTSILSGVVDGGPGTAVELAFTPVGSSEAIKRRTFTITRPNNIDQGKGYYEFRNLPPSPTVVYKVTATRSAYIFNDVAQFTVQANVAKDITANTVCTFDPASIPMIPASGGPVDLTITTNAPSCEWLAKKNSDWIVINDGAIVNSGPVHFNADPNPGAARTGSILISGRTDPVMFQQAGAGPPSFEGDINRTALGVPGTGDGDINVGDQIQYQRFLNGTDCPSTGEQPRLDAGPRATRGDGLLGSTDGTAIDAYARHDGSTDFDPNVAGWQPTPVGGPTAITNLGCTPPSAPKSETAGADAIASEPAVATAARTVSLVSVSGAVNTDVFAEVELEAQGNEVGMQYSIHFDPAVMSISNVTGLNTNPDVTLGSGAPVGTKLNVNADDVANGNIGIGQNFNGANTNPATVVAVGTQRIVRLKFHILPTAPNGASAVTFTNNPLNRGLFDENGFTIPLPPFTDGSVTVGAGPPVSVGGRVTSPNGTGLRSTTVFLTDPNGVRRTATTSSFGFYQFDDVPSGVTYTLGVTSRSYRFSTRQVNVTGALTNIDFVGLE